MNYRLLFISLCISLVHNQASALEFNCMCFQGTYSGIYFSQGEDSDAQVEINDFRISRKYTYTGASPLIFFTKSQTPEGEVVRTPVAQFPFDPRYKKLLFIFYPNPAQQGTYQIYPIATDDQSMPPGSYRVQNQTRKQVAMLLNGQTYQFASGQLQVLNPPAAKEETFELDLSSPDEALSPDAAPEPETLTAAARIPVHLAYQTEEGQWETFFKKKWLYRPDIRTFVFIYNIDGVLQLRNFVEFIN